MRLPRAKMADDMNAQVTLQTEQDRGKKNQQLTNATDTMSDSSLMSPDSENANYMLKTPDPDLPNMPTLPSLPTSRNSTFYLAPSISEAMQRLPPAMPVSPSPFCFFSDSPNPGQTTLESDYNTAESFPNNQTLIPSSNNTFTSETTQQEQSKDPKHAAGFFARVDEESSSLKEQATIGQQKEKESDARVISTGMFQAGSLVSDSRLMGKMLDLREAQLERKDRELAAAQTSNTQMRTRLSDMEDELARVQAKVKQKNIYISACDKKIDALQKKIALLTRPYRGPTVGHIRTETKMDAKAEPQFHMSTSKPKKIYIPHTQPSGESRLNGVNYADPSQEKKASFNRPCEQSLRRQAELEDRYIVRARGDKRRRVAEGYLWGNHEPSKETKELGQENEEFREGLDQTHTVDTSKSGPFSFRPKMSGGALDTVSQQEISETATSRTEADHIKYTDGEGHGDIGQRANSLLSRKSSCSSDWENVEGVDLKKEWPYAW
ncbi:hypothetical protein KCU73_g2703, partial [Aureobasidium melanogenum]